jgi:hypothetical protein
VCRRRSGLEVNNSRRGGRPDATIAAAPASSDGRIDGRRVVRNWAVVNLKGSPSALTQTHLHLLWLPMSHTFQPTPELEMVFGTFRDK